MVFSIIEFLGGIFTNSVAISSDAIHDMGDAISIGISYFLERISKKKPNEEYTFGYIRYSVMGSFITSVLLIVGSCFVIGRSIYKFFNPGTIHYSGMIFLAIFGVLINFMAAYFTQKGESLNQNAVHLHMLEDVLGWVVVLIGAIVMKFTNAYYIDSLLSIGVALFIFIEALKNFEKILSLFLEKTPSGVSVEKLIESIKNIKGVKDVHHIHVWSMDGYSNYATMHIVYEGKSQNVKENVKRELKKLGICHTTIELEDTKELCKEIPKNRT